MDINYIGETWTTEITSLVELGRNQLLCRGSRFELTEINICSKKIKQFFYISD